MTNIKTRLGQLSGIDQGATKEFRGVPFAKPLQAELRFRAPQPVDPWQGTLACEVYAGAAWQESNALLGVAEQSLDCLRLNIWVPKGKGPFPVMVWYHGGAYTAGSPSQLLYNGARLAEQQQVIVVNAGYRLGAMGFGLFKEWLPDSDSNLGLRDQIAALEWVNTHIADFGGNPDQVTVFGESAGGFSVACLMACKKAQPLFQHVISQSGAGDMVLAPEEARRVTATFVEALGGGDKLLIADRDTWVKAQRACYRMTVARGLRANTPQFGMSWLPTVDNDLLTDLPVNAVARGCAVDKTLLAGVCRDEWNLFQYAMPFNGDRGIEQFREIEAAEVERRFHRALPVAEQAEAAFALYSQLACHPERGKLDWYAALESDRLFIVPTQRLLDAQTKAGGKAHAFVFTHEAEMFGTPLGACHVSDVPFVFDLVDKPIGKLFTGGGEAAAELAKQVQCIWGNLAHGRPLDWPVWDLAREAKTLGPGAPLRRLLPADYEPVWEQIIPPAL